MSTPEGEPRESPETAPAPAAVPDGPSDPPTPVSPDPVSPDPVSLEEAPAAAESSEAAAEIETQDPPSKAESAPRAEAEAPEPEAAGAAGAAEAAVPEKKRPARREFPPVPPERLEAAIEALLLASGDVLSVDRMRDLLGLTSVIHIREALERIETRWSEASLPVSLQEVAGGIRVATRPEYAEYVRRLSRRPEVDKLSPSLMETLSIVAYRQPVPRVEIERIRGVQCGEGLRSLLERRLLKVVGRSDRPGRPLLYGTTRRFLEVFGLKGLKDLPAKGDLKRL